MKSDAVIVLLAYLGGLWRILGIILNLIPRLLRDWGYDCIGHFRYKIFGKTTGICPLIQHNKQGQVSPCWLKNNSLGD
jgi:predicted DCC family thiol-disulfide oxidoreductase YuxK